MADLEGASEEAVEEADPGEEEETDVSSVEIPGISLENAQWVQEEELGLEPASATTVGRSAISPGNFQLSFA